MLPVHIVLGCVTVRNLGMLAGVKLCMQCYGKLLLTIPPYGITFLVCRPVKSALFTYWFQKMGGDCIEKHPRKVGGKSLYEFICSMAISRQSLGVGFSQVDTLRSVKC